MLDSKWCIYIPVGPLSNVFYIHTFTHTFIHDGGGNYARHQPTHWEQLGFQNLAEGLFDSNSGEPGIELGSLRELSVFFNPELKGISCYQFEFTDITFSQLGTSICEVTFMQLPPRVVHSAY